MSHPIASRAVLETAAARLVDAVSAAAPAAETAVTVTRHEYALTRFANSAIHQNHDEDTVGVRIQVHLDGRTTAAEFGPDAMADPAVAVAAVLDAVRSGPVDASWPGLAPPTESAVPSPTDTEQWPAEARAAAVREFVDAAGGLEAAGYCSTKLVTVAFANSAGHAASYRSRDASFDGIARRDGVDGVARLSTGDLGQIDAGRLGRRAAAKARRGADQVELPPGRYEVVLEPPAVADILANFAMFGFNGRSVLDGASFVRAGSEQFDPAISIVDDSPAAGETFDVEGTPRARVELVRDGTTVLVPQDRRTAIEAGLTSTGHASGSASWGPFPLYLGLAPGSPGGGGPAPGDDRSDGADGDDDDRHDDDAALVHPSAAPFVAGVADGLLVSDFWYTRVLDPRALTITGLTRNGVWRIRDGRVAEAVRNFRFTQAYPAALAAGSVLGVGAIADGQPDVHLPARWTAPALHLASWNFTGGASG